MKLVPDWKEAWRWISVNCMAIAMAVQGAWMFIPDDLKASAPQHVAHMLTIVLLVLGIAGRLIQQGSKDV